MPNKALTQLQVQSTQFVEIVASNGFRLKFAWLFALCNPSLVNAVQYKNACCVVRDKRIQRVHYQVEDFLQVQRAANRSGNVQQHAQLVDRRQGPSSSLL